MGHDAQHDHLAKIQRRAKDASQDAGVWAPSPTGKLGVEAAMIGVLGVLGSSVRCEKLLHVFAWAWIHVNVHLGVRLMQRYAFVSGDVWGVALLSLFAATTVR
jgi:hypothetical protein